MLVSSLGEGTGAPMEQSIAKTVISPLTVTTESNTYIWTVWLDWSLQNWCLVDAWGHRIPNATDANPIFMNLSEPDESRGQFQASRLHLLPSTFHGTHLRLCPQELSRRNKKKKRNFLDRNSITDQDSRQTSVLANALPRPLHGTKWYASITTIMFILCRF